MTNPLGLRPTRPPSSRKSPRGLVVTRTHASANEPAARSGGLMMTLAGDAVRKVCSREGSGADDEVVIA